jgi:hypothetical protein
MFADRDALTTNLEAGLLAKNSDALTTVVGAAVGSSSLTRYSRVAKHKALNVSAGTARFRQLSGAFRKTYTRREPFSTCCKAAISRGLSERRRRVESGHSHRSDLSGALIASSWLLSGARKLIIAAAVIMAAPGAALSLVTRTSDRQGPVV